MCARTVGKVCVWLRFVQPRLLRLIFLTACKTLANDMSHPVRALTLIFLGCPAAAPPRASSSRQRSRGRSRRSRSSNHRGAGDFHHPGLIASRLFALWVEGPTRRSTDLSFRVSPAWRAHFLYQWRVEPGTRTAPILGHRVVHSPAGRVGPGGAGGVRGTLRRSLSLSLVSVVQ